MLALAREQMRFFCMVDPSAPIGGRLIVTEVTRDGISHKVAGQLNRPLFSRAIGSVASLLRTRA